MTRILFLADTHLGFDMPFRPRTKRRRRGRDFFRNFVRALRPARRGEVDCVVHGGDLLYRSKVPPQLVAMAFEPLKAVADRGVPVYLVPGNHERSQIPYRLLAQHPRIHIFDRPRMFELRVNGNLLVLAGFPFQRHEIRRRFSSLLAETGWRESRAGARVLCIHQCVDGARVGPGDFVFRRGPDVVRSAEIPVGLAAVLSGHVHRAQVLTRGSSGKPLAVPVLYPGSIERTSFAEKDEPKGFMTLEIETARADPRLRGWRFHELPARPMIELEIDATSSTEAALRRRLEERLQALPPDAVVKVKVRGKTPAENLEILSTPSLRALAPPTMNVSLQLPRRQEGSSGQNRPSATRRRVSDGAVSRFATPLRFRGAWR